MPDRSWVIAQFAVAGLLLALTVAGLVALAVEFEPVSGSLTGILQSLAIFPGTVLSLVANGLIMRSHRDAGLSEGERGLLAFEFVLIGVLIVLHLIPEAVWGDTIWAAVVVWPIHITVAVVVFIAAVVRARRLRAAASAA